MIYRLIAPSWLVEQGFKKVYEGEFTDEEIRVFNARGYNCYYLPNTIDNWNPSIRIAGKDINIFRYVFVDFDCKSSKGRTKAGFIETICNYDAEPSSIIDSGNGIHAYWQVTNLDALSYLRFQRRLIRLFDTDEAVGQIFQLMRVPGTLNTKDQENFLPCVLLYESDAVYTSETFDSVLPPISVSDELYCQQHMKRTYEPDAIEPISDELPLRFKILLHSDDEVNTLWNAQNCDRSRRDYRLGCIMYERGFTQQEAASVLINSSKARSRSLVHRESYVMGIIDKVWEIEESLVHYGT